MAATLSTIRKHGWLIVLVLGSALLLPLLGSYGLWDPVEIQQADVAQEVARKGSFLDVTVDGRYGHRPPLYVWLVAGGFKVLGVNELAGRLPLALLAVLTLLVVYRVGKRLVSAEAGLAAALVLATTPVFLFQGRQLAGQMPLYLSLIASAGGLLAYLWPASGRRCTWDLVLGCAGLVTGFLSGGLLMGTLFPLLGLCLTLLLGWNTPSGDRAAAAVEPAPTGRDLFSQPTNNKQENSGAAVTAATLGAAVRQASKPLLVGLVTSGAAIALFLGILRGKNYLLLGGVYHKVHIPPTLDQTFKEIGWGFFPWIGLLPVALLLFTAAQGHKAAERRPESVAKALAAVMVVAGFVVAVVWEGYLGDVRFPALPWAALAVGLLCAEVATGRAAPRRVWGLLALGLVLVVHQDYVMNPESLAFAHLLESAKYPIELKIKTEARVFGIGLGVLVFFALGGVSRRVTGGFSDRFWGRLADRGAALVDYGAKAAQSVLGRRGERALAALGVAAVVFAGWCVYYLVPQLSLHMSNKALFSTFHRCKSGGEMLAQYQVPGRGAAYYNNGQVEEVTDQGHLFRLLREEKRWFVLVPSHQLAPIDKAARQQKLDYYVLDDRSSKYLMLSNKLTGRCDQDHNPLRRFVKSEPPDPRHKLKVNFENKVELLGYDVDDVVTRGGKFPITLYFKVLSQMPSGYKVFIHFDQPANRFHGDHEPLGGKYPTEYWLPGDYVIDRHEVEIPIITTPSGSYTMYMGFWLGENRLKVLEGPNDGVNRVRLGELRVR